MPRPKAASARFPYNHRTIAEIDAIKAGNGARMAWLRRQGVHSIGIGKILDGESFLASPRVARGQMTANNGGAGPTSDAATREVSVSHGARNSIKGIYDHGA